MNTERLFGWTTRYIPGCGRLGQMMYKRMPDSHLWTAALGGNECPFKTSAPARAKMARGVSSGLRNLQPSKLGRSLGFRRV